MEDLERCKRALAWTSGRIEYLRDELLSRLAQRLERERGSAMSHDPQLREAEVTVLEQHRAGLELETTMIRLKLLAETLEQLDQAVDAVVGTAAKIADS